MFLSTKAPRGQKHRQYSRVVQYSRITSVLAPGLTCLLTGPAAEFKLRGEHASFTGDGVDETHPVGLQLKRSGEIVNGDIEQLRIERIVEDRCTQAPHVQPNLVGSASQRGCLVQRQIPSTFHHPNFGYGIRFSTTHLLRLQNATFLDDVTAHPHPTVTVLKPHRAAGQVLRVTSYRAGKPSRARLFLRVCDAGPVTTLNLIDDVVMSSLAGAHR